MPEESVLLAAEALPRLVGELPADAFWLLEEGTVALGPHVPGRGDQVLETIGPGTVPGWSWHVQGGRQAAQDAGARWRGRCSAAAWGSGWPSTITVW